MLSKDTAYRLDHAVTDEKVSDEIAARLISQTPADPSEAQAVLDILDSSEKMTMDIAERLYVGLAGDADGRAGKELAKKINGMVKVLKAQANNDAIALASALGAMGSEHMSKDTFECLVHALTDRAAAEEFKAAYDSMVDAVQAITL